MELLYIDFLYSGISTLGIYPKGIVPEIFYFQWLARSKMQRMYQNILKEGYGVQKFLRCTYLRYNSFAFLHSEIALDKVDLLCSEPVKSKPTGNN